ncbi:MAG TPA: helicase-related protein, partial [bacterium]|nr:helicase-related protein [bacterium]
DEKIEQGAQVYVIAPLIDESDAFPTLSTVRERHEHLAEIVFPHRRVGLLHGRLSSEEKLQILGKFFRGELDVLVSTTVIEVGVDVARASVMLIESSERFGLAQLHQLRGRIGRGQLESYCLLMTGSECSENARKRLKILEKTDDGFRIAEADLAMRGPGELAGYRQSGAQAFRIADLERDSQLLIEAWEDALRIVKEDPRLDQYQHRLLRRRLESLPQLQVVTIG